jgi:cell wall-associated NlpC family hydrolase
MIGRTIIAGAIAFLTIFPVVEVRGQQQHSSVQQSEVGADSNEESTSTDFLSDDEWRHLPREERRRRSRASNIARYEPDGKPKSERLSAYVSKYHDVVVYDSRLAYFDVHASLVPATTDTIELTGEVSVPQYKDGIATTLDQLGFHIARNDIVVLPSPQLGKEIYGIATTTAATLRKEPRSRAEQVNSVPLGGWLRLLREAKPGDTTSQPQRHSRPGPSEPAGLKWYLAQSPEAYLGFVRSDQFVRQADYTLPDAMVITPTTATIENHPFPIPTGTLLHQQAEGYIIPGLSVLLPPGANVVKLGRTSFTKDELLKIAKPLMQTHYEWGGVTDKGIDCSGFTQFLFKNRGIFLPRDAEEQAIVGQIVAFGTDAQAKAEPGDVLFFVGENGKINHVAMSLGGGQVIHSSGPGVHISSLTEKSDGHERSLLDRVIFAKRMLGR